MQLSGPVKTLSETLYKPMEKESDITVKSIRTKTVTHFNRDGNITDDELYNSWGTDMRTVDTFSYDEKGNRHCN